MSALSRRLDRLETDFGGPSRTILIWGGSDSAEEIQRRAAEHLGATVYVLKWQQPGGDSE